MFKNRDGLVNEKIKERGEKNDSHEIPSRITRHIEFNLGLYTSRSAAAAARLTDGKKECHIISGGVEEEEKGETPNNKERGLWWNPKRWMAQTKLLRLPGSIQESHIVACIYVTEWPPHIYPFTRQHTQNVCWYIISSNILSEIYIYLWLPFPWLSFSRVWRNGRQLELGKKMCNGRSRVVGRRPFFFFPHRWMEQSNGWLGKSLPLLLSAAIDHRGT